MSSNAETRHLPRFHFKFLDRHQPQYPQEIPAVTGLKKHRLESKLYEMICYGGKFDGKSWNEACSVIIDLVGGKKIDKVTKQSQPLKDPWTGGEIVVFRLNGPSHDRGVVQFVSPNDQVQTGEMVKYGCDGCVHLPPNEAENARNVLARVYDVYQRAQNRPQN